MNIGLFGGSFDPIHRGHLALAEAAAARYSLHQVLFVPANVPPHKQKQPLTEFIHRFTMVALATREDRRFTPSLLEANADGKAAVNYSIDTVRRLKRQLKKSDQLYFLIGVDAFRDIAKWREARALLAECAFVVASRPGYSLRDLAESLPEPLKPRAAVTRASTSIRQRATSFFPASQYIYWTGCSRIFRPRKFGRRRHRANHWRAGSIRQCPTNRKQRLYRTK